MFLYHTIMSRPPFYPIFLNLQGQPVVVVGAGKVALRKTKGVLEAGARVLVIAPRWEPDFEQLPVRLRKREFRPSDLRGARLVLTATDVRGVNHAVAEEAKRRGIPVNVADCPPECDFLVPARVRRGDLQIAVSTGGKSPRMAAQLRRRLEETLD